MAAEAAAPKVNPNETEEESMRFERAGPKLFEMYNEELCIFYTEGNSESYNFVDEGDLFLQKVNMDTFHIRAVENMYQLVSSLTVVKMNGIYSLSMPGDLDAGLILCPAVWVKERLPVPGDYVIGIPSRGHIWVTGSKDAYGLMSMKEAVEKAFDKDSYPISKELFRYDGKKFQPYGQ